MMKKTLFAGAALATLLNANASCDSISLQGLHFGLGFVVNFDEHEAEVDTVDAMYRFGNAGGEWETSDILANVNVWNNNDEAKAVINAIKAYTQDGNFTEDIIAGGNTTIFDTNSTVTIKNADTNYSAYLLRSHKLKRRATNCGGEIKIAYFHDFGNHLMFGVDFGCAFNSKAKKKINIAGAENTTTGGLSYKLESPNGTTVVTWKEDGSVTFDGTNNKLTNPNHAIVKAESSDSGTDSSDKYNATLIAKNSGSILGGDNGDINDQTTVEANKYLHVGDATELSFEKDIFAPRLAFVVGGTVYGWFAGVRTGVSYMTGKIRGSDGTRSVNKSVSISSPFIGIQVMKQMPILKNNAHVYLTADWNMGDGHRAVNMNGVKSYKQNNVNVALGVTWRCKFGA